MDNTVKIGDFGLVSAFGEDKSTKKRKNDDDKFDRLSVFETASVTSDAGENNEIGGTILYMSPEQVAHIVDASFFDRYFRFHSMSRSIDSLTIKKWISMQWVLFCLNYSIHFQHKWDEFKHLQKFDKIHPSFQLTLNV